MNRFNPKRHSLRALCLGATLAVIACHDAPTDPFVVVLASEEGLIAPDVRLPSLARLVEQAGAEAEFGDAAERWTRSWGLSPERGGELRREAHEEVAERLAHLLGAGAVAAELTAVEEALRAVEALESRALDGEVAESLLDAQGDHAGAREAVAMGDHAEALALTLRASDRIREVGPEAVGRLLLARAEEALEARASGRAGDGASPLSQEDLARATRLVRGARMALADGDPMRALQRAFYAGQLLGTGRD